MRLGEATLDPSGHYRIGCALFDGVQGIYTFGPDSGNRIDPLAFETAVVKGFPQTRWFRGEVYSFLLRSFEDDPVCLESGAILEFASG